MRPLQKALHQAGYQTANIDYPSTRHPIATLAPRAITAGIKQCPPTARLHFVTHSMGGILVRHYYRDRPTTRVDRVVMLAPPNHGSAVVDYLRRLPGYILFNGPSGQQLGTTADGLPRTLPPVPFALGVIAGNRSLLPTSLLLRGEDDGLVTTASARAAGMRDFIILPTTHGFIPHTPAAIRESLHFLKHGAFSATAPRPPPTLAAALGARPPKPRAGPASPRSTPLRPW